MSQLGHKCQPCSTKYPRRKYLFYPFIVVDLFVGASFGVSDLPTSEINVSSLQVYGFPICFCAFLRFSTCTANCDRVACDLPYNNILKTTSIQIYTAHWLILLRTCRFRFLMAWQTQTTRTSKNLSTCSFKSVGRIQTFCSAANCQNSMPKYSKSQRKILKP